MLTRAAKQILAQREQHRAERYERIGRQMPPPTLHRAVVGGGTRAAAPKSTAYRNPTLLEMADRRPCLLLVPGVCNHRTDTTTAAHSNLGIHGKAKNRKADDCYSAWGCFACHRWLDQPIGHDGPSREQKAAVFMEAHLRQVLAWRQIAADPTEPERFRRAASRALERLNATPIGETTA